MVNKKLLGIALIIFIICLLAMFLNYRYNLELARQRNEPIFILKIRNAKKPEQFSGKKIVSPVIGFNSSYSVWLNINDWDYRKKEYKHIFHLGLEDGSNCAPGVWLTPNKNDMVIRFDTDTTNNRYNAELGYPDYLETILTEISSGNTTNSNYLFAQNIASNTNDTIVPKTYKDILVEYDKAEKIIIFVTKDTSLEYDTVPLSYLIIYKISDETSSTNLNDPSNYSFGTDTSGNSITMDIYTLSLSDEFVSLNPETEVLLDTTGKSMTVENVPLNRWFNLVILVSDQNLNVYIDSYFYGSVGFSGAIKSNNGDLFATQNGGFGGLISHLRYYNSELTQKEIADLYYRGPNGSIFPRLDYNIYPYNIQVTPELVLGEDFPSLCKLEKLPSVIDQKIAEQAEIDYLYNTKGL